MSTTGSLPCPPTRSLHPLPTQLAPLALLVLVGWAWRVGRARPNAGRRHGRPPGSLGLGASIRALREYRFYERESARHGPVFKTSQYGRPVVCVVGLDRCQRFLRENADRLTSAPLPIHRDVSGGLLRYMEPDSHGRYRRLLQAAMRPQVLSSCEGWIEARTALEFGRLAQASVAPGGMTPWAAIDRIVFDALARVFFGIAPEERASSDLRRLFRIVDHRRTWRGRSRTRRAMRALSALVLERSSDAPADSFLGQALQGDPALSDDPVFVENLVYFFHIARCDLTGLCGWLLKMVLDQPEWVRRIRVPAEGTPRERDGAAGWFVDETLRLRQSEYLYRTTSAPLRFEGWSIPAGWLVRLCIRESHTRPEAHVRPYMFDPERFRDGLPPLERYQPFGIYEHACLGMALTRTLGRIFVERLALGFDGEIRREAHLRLARRESDRSFETR